MAIPANIIIAWSGAINEIPNGWVLCDGQNNTPDLRNRFIVGAGSLYGLNATGGSADATLISHTHGASNISTIGNHSHTVSGRSNTGGGTVLSTNNTMDSISFFNVQTSFDGAHEHVVTTTETGESPLGKNLPPYYSLAFIMKGAE